MFLALSFLAVLSARADNVFTGPGLFTDTTKWSKQLLPTNTVSEDIRMKGHCGATNVAERLQGGKWCHIGYAAAGRLDVKNCDFYFATTRISNGGHSGIYSHAGGSAWFSDKLSIGHESNYTEAGVVFDGVAVTNAAITVGNQPSKNKEKGAAYLHAKNTRFKSNNAILAANRGEAVFENSTINGGYLRAQGGGSIALIDSFFTSSNTGLLYSGYGSGTGTIAATNSTIYAGEKTYLGGGSGYCGIFDFKDSVWTNRYQVYVGNENASTGIVNLVGSTVCFQSNLGIGHGAGSFGEMVLGPGTVSQKLGEYAYVGDGSNSFGRLVFDGVDWTKIRGPSNGYRVAAGLDSIGQIVYRDIAGRRAYTLATVYSPNNTGGYAETVFDNSSYYNSSSAEYFGQDNRKAKVVVMNGGTFDATSSGDIWLPGGDIGASAEFFVTNSPLFVINASGYVKHEKANAQLHFTFHNTIGGIATNTTFRMAEGSGAKASVTVSGNSFITIHSVMCFSAGESVFNLDGGVLCLGAITSGAPQMNFNGGTLQSKSGQTSWIPAAAICSVEEGGAVFDARHAVTVPSRLQHGGSAAKDGGVVKKGPGTLTLSSASAHDFTGDIVVEEGTLVMTALSDYALAAGQKIGGSGTLEVGSGFIAGGVRFDGTWSDGLTVDGNVSFAPGSTVDVTGVTKKTERKRFTILSADAVSGAENLSAAGMPDGWKLRVTDKSVSIVRDDGFIFVIR